jgi:hypothetical protein
MPTPPFGLGRQRSDAFPDELATASATCWTAIAVSSRPEIRVSSSMPAWPSSHLQTPASRSVSHSTTKAPTSPSATPTPIRSAAVLVSRMNTMIAAIAPGPASSGVPSGTKAMFGLALAGQPLDVAAKQVKGDDE